MKYYLGRLKQDGYHPINCIEETDIVSVINYTSNFDSELDLRKELVSKNLIDGDEYLAYIYIKNNKASKMKKGDNIAYSYSKSYITANDIYHKLVAEMFNLDLYKFILDVIEYDLRKVDHPVAVRTNINRLYNEVANAHEIGVEKYKNLNEGRKVNYLRYLILNFLTSYYGEWDKDKKQYKVKDGSLCTNKRKVVDFVLILNSYYYDEEYKAEVELHNDEEDNNQNNENTNYEYEDYDKEEFLTEEDFVSNGMNPDEYKRLIRK